MPADGSCVGLSGMRFAISERAVVRGWIGAVAVLVAIIVVATIAGLANGSGVHQPPASTPSRRAGPGPIAASFSDAPYRTRLVLTPNRASVRNRVALEISRGGRALNGARVTLSYSMPAMNMSNVFMGHLRAGAGGSYGALEPVLGMPGAWELRLEVRPPHARAFTVLVDDRMVR